MEAPDKIYITLDGDVRWSESEPLAINEEYIRKDALLEKLSRAKNLRLKSGENESSDGIRIIDALIKMINEM